MTPLLAITTIDSEAAAQHLARVLVEERLVACVNIVAGVQSIYRWDNAVCDSREWLCLMKTTTDRYPVLEARVRELHSYDCPEIIAVPIAHGAPEYFKWMTEQLSIAVR